MTQKNKKVPGLFKDEYLRMPLHEWVGLKSKMYEFKKKKKSAKA